MEQKNTKESTVIIINKDGMGHAEKELQQKLISTYLRLLEDSDVLPEAICFYADGVKLVVEGSPVLDTLTALENKGVHLIICQTCLNYYGLREQVKVGIVGGMTDIIAAQWKADKVITL